MVVHHGATVPCSFVAKKLVTELKGLSKFGDFVQAVSARELHAFLEVAKDFPDWIKAQIDRVRLVRPRGVRGAHLKCNPLRRPAAPSSARLPS